MYNFLNDMQPQDIFFFWKGSYTRTRWVLNPWRHLQGEEVSVEQELIRNHIIFSILNYYVDTIYQKKKKKNYYVYTTLNISN